MFVELMTYYIKSYNFFQINPFIFILIVLVQFVNTSCLEYSYLSKCFFLFPVSLSTLLKPNIFFKKLILNHAIFLLLTPYRQEKNLRPLAVSIF